MTPAATLGATRELSHSRIVNTTFGVACFIALTALGAYVRIPVPGSPVPITLQTFFAILSGAVLGRRLGPVSQCGYIMLGALGLPVFQGYSSGAVVLMGPTGGYLIGFVVASYVIGRIVDRGASHVVGFAVILGAFAAGHLIIYACGVSYLALVCRMGLGNAIALGAVPFLPGDMIKAAAATAIYSRIAERARQIFPA